MTTKILTVRIPVPVYSELCTSAAELGVPVSAHVRRLIEQEHQAQQLAQVRTELLAKLDSMASAAPATSAPSPVLLEIVLLCRAVAAHLSPQMVSHVRAKLTSPQ